MVQTSAPWTRAPRSRGFAGSRSRRPPGATATRARASTSTRGRARRAPCTSGSPTPPSCTGSPAAAPRVALHIPWDAVDDYAELRRYAEGQGVRIGAINPNLFGTDEYRLGSLCHPDAGVRAQALEHCRECVEIAGEIGSTIVSLWLADGTNYPGQDDLRARHARLRRGPRRALRPPAAGDAAARRVQVLRAGLLQHRPARLGHRGDALPQPRPAGAGARGHRPPPAGDERRADRGASCSARGCSAASTSTTASTPTTT